MPGSVQGWVGWDLEQHGIVEGVPAHDGAGMRLSLRPLPRQTILGFCEFVCQNNFHFT